MKAGSNYDGTKLGEGNRELPGEPEEFYPKGAIAFFVCLMVGFGLIWGGLYMIMVHRAFHL